MNNLGFIGLGNMGKGMVENLVKNGLNVSGYDIDEEVFKKFKNINLEKVSNIQNLAHKCDIIITMLPDGNAVEKVWSELIPNCKSGTVLVDCSTIDVKTSIETQENAKKNNLLTLDAPVSGGVIGADNGSLTFMVGGDKNVYNEIKFLFDIMGNNSILCGNIGAGQSAKICNNLLLATTMIAVGESFSLGKNLGLDLNKLFDVISTSSGSCWAVNNYCPIKGVGPLTPSDNDFKGGFSGSLMYKDLGLAIDAANNTKTNLSYGIKTLEKFESLINKKQGHLDFSNIINQ